MELGIAVMGGVWDLVDDVRLQCVCGKVGRGEGRMKVVASLFFIFHCFFITKSKVNCVLLHRININFG